MLPGNRFSTKQKTHFNDGAQQEKSLNKKLFYKTKKE